ncbi:ATP-dependent RNA helicase WM6-like isoform X2 [Sitodiplosis mosellana]|uniref:ATP-dependent RNA helicase WM6-like isoform X2 n=1 Tax=Sitodiplosis mosellana TaxID=263140 RepID=UPI0024450542|nr:ATP-dependent RNA helicase WM6-like isoform X2 [Sitodiplosis mosellana]
MELHSMMNERQENATTMADFHGIRIDPEICNAFSDSKPSNADIKCIHKFLKGNDILLQTKSELGPSRMVILSSMQQFQQMQSYTYILVICTNELGEKIYNELENFNFASLRIGLLGKPSIGNDEEMLQEPTPHIIIGTPARISALIFDKEHMLNDTINIIVFDSEIMVNNLDHLVSISYIMEKQKKKKVMMFSNETCRVARHWFEKWVEKPIEVFDDAITKLNINGLQHYYVVLDEMQKIETLTEFLNILQIKSLIFVESMEKGHKLKDNLSVLGIEGVSTDEKEFPNEKSVLITTDSIAPKLKNIQVVKTIFNFERVEHCDDYVDRLNCVVGQNNAKIVTFVSSENDAVLKEFERRFGANIRTVTPQTILSRFDRYKMAIAQFLLDLIQPVYQKIKAIKKN